ncbi:MFS transporter [Brevibacillus sp. NRS-1366]|uniref:MFS transporter n=1 Tax=Brevibacillus sp. NRS-1366 TaxID=3233899 RepID=UPI003D1E5EC1
MSVKSELPVNEEVCSNSVPGKANRRQVVNATVASLLGWSFDLFDLFILLFVAPTVGKLFFPATNPMFQLAATYGSFAVTLLMRPIGSAVFGSYADRYGRKKAMIIAVVGVGIATALFGALPTVEQIGIAATVLFLLLRLIQGVFVGGVVASTHTIGTETVPPKWRGLMSGLVGGGGAGLGSFFASIVYFAVSSAFPGQAFDEWGWRIMFFSGILSSIFGIFIFKSLDESPLWLEAQKAKQATNKPQKSPIRTVFGQYFSTMLVNLLIVAGGGTAYYLTTGYLPTFLHVVNEIPSSTASRILMIISIVVIISTALVGYLSDLLGRKKTFIVTGILCMVGLPFFYMKLAGATDITQITIYACVLTFLANAAYAPTLIFLNERFPTAVRSTGTGLCWNIGFAVGGMMPTFVSLTSGSVSALPATLGYFLAGIFILYIIGSWIIPETKGQFK